MQKRLHLCAELPRLLLLRPLPLAGDEDTDLVVRVFSAGTRKCMGSARRCNVCKTAFGPQDFRVHNEPRRVRMICRGGL